MKRGHTRPGKSFGKLEQERVLRERGFSTLYENNPDAAVNAVRKDREGGVLGVVGYRGLASSEAEVLRLLDKLHDKGCAAVDAVTGRRSDGRDGNALMREFQIDMRVERQSGRKQSRMNGAAGGNAAAANREGKRAPKDKALQMWKDLSIATNAEAVDKINSLGYLLPWLPGALYNQFGKSGRLTGRRSV